MALYALANQAETVKPYLFQPGAMWRAIFTSIRIGTRHEHAVMLAFFQKVAQIAGTLVTLKFLFILAEWRLIKGTQLARMQAFAFGT